MAGPDQSSLRSAGLEVVLSSGQRTRIPIDAIPFRMGRAADNHLIVRDNRASRVHARILFEGQCYLVEDLDSRHGTWLNGKRISGRAALANGDSIHFGFQDSYQLHFSVGESGVTRILDQLTLAQQGPAGSLTRLRSLLEIARSLQTSLSTKDILAGILDAALSVTHTERGFLLLKKGAHLGVEIGRSAEGLPLDHSDLNVPTSVIQQALQNRRHLLSMNFQPQEDAQKSKKGGNVRSVICVPLIQLRSINGQETMALSSAGDTVGLLYLDSRAQAAELSNQDRQLVQTLALEASTVLENTRLLEEERAKQRLEEELSIAREIQASLLPHELPLSGWFRAAGASLPSIQVAGDYFDVRRTRPDQWSGVVADVSGKGVSSALLASLLQGSFLLATDMAVPLDQLLSRMNAFLHERTQGEKYATLVYFTVSESGVLEWANAAQCRPLLLQADGKISSLETTGMPLGLLAEAEFEVRRLQLQPGDKLVAYTDGLSDAENNQGEQFGPRIRALLTAHRHEPAPRILDTLVEAVATFTEESSLSDDVTILVVEYAGSAGSNSVA